MSGRDVMFASSVAATSKRETQSLADAPLSYLIHKPQRVPGATEHARPPAPASCTTSGTLATAAPAAVVILSVPTRWPWASGATSGSVRSTTRLQLVAFAVWHGRRTARRRRRADASRCCALPHRHAQRRLAAFEQAHGVPGA